MDCAADSSPKGYGAPACLYLALKLGQMLEACAELLLVHLEGSFAFLRSVRALLDCRQKRIPQNTLAVANSQWGHRGLRNCEVTSRDAEIRVNVEDVGCHSL